MDFTTLARLVAAGTYGTWGAMLADLELMFVNATKYNPPDSVYHKQARPGACCLPRLGLAETGARGPRASAAWKAPWRHTGGPFACQKQLCVQGGVQAMAPFSACCCSDPDPVPAAAC